MPRSNLTHPSRAGQLPARVGRQVDGQLARIEAGLAVARAADRARIRRTAGATEDGLVANACLSTLEALTVHIAPHAEARAKLIADTGAFGLRRIVEDASSS